MESKYIKLSYNDAVDAKKQILNCELDIIKALKSLRIYKILRKKEFAIKNKLKSDINFINNKFEILASSFPEEEKIKF